MRRNDHILQLGRRANPAGILSARGLGRVAGALVALLLLASCIDGPVPGTASIPVGINVSPLGYQQSEFFIGGYADAYTPTGALGTDGRWNVAVDEANSGVRFKTRMVVIRPVDPAAFNGTVVIEWLNVTAGSDLANDWISAHNEFLRSGAIWVGVSAQAAGVTQLKTCCSARYSSLDHPGDSYSYDMFTQVAKAIRTDRAVTGGLKPQRLVATGQSQSASRLVTYIDAIQTFTHAFDGFLVHGRGSSGAPLSQTPLATVATPSPSLIRTDRLTPVFIVQAEDDVIRSNLAVRQPDSKTFRQWELAGTAHADAYMTNVGFSDTGDGTGATRMFNLMRSPNPAPTGCGKPINAGGLHWTLQAAFAGLDTWMRTGLAPPKGLPLQVESLSPLLLARDAHGNALGGVRSAHVDAPVATVDGINTGTGFCRLFGSTTPFSTAELTALYPTHAEFVAAWSTALDEAVAGRFLLPADAAELLAAAEAAPIPS